MVEAGGWPAPPDGRTRRGEEMRAEFVRKLLTGDGSHLHPARAFDGLEPVTAGRRVEGVPYTVHRILRHLVFWQDVYLRRLAGERVVSPDSAEEGWPGEDRPSAEEWEAAVARFAAGLDEALEAASGDLDGALPSWGGITRGEGLGFLAVHNAWHAGQAVTPPGSRRLATPRRRALLVAAGARRRISSAARPPRPTAPRARPPRRCRRGRPRG